MTKPRIAVPVPTSSDEDYNERNWPVFAAAVDQAGGAAVRVPLDLSEEELTALMDSCGGVLLPGSLFDVDPAAYGREREAETADADADRERTDRFLIETAMRGKKPLLGVCFGAQMLNVALGGALRQDVGVDAVRHAQPAEATVHEVEVAPRSVLAGLVPERVERVWVNSSHHQAVATLGEGLWLTATSPADGVIEAFEGRDGFLLGVQWHPERTVGQDATSRALFARLIAEAGK